MTVYLDYHATAPLHPRAHARMLALMDLPANASSLHRHGQAARKHLEHARRSIAEALNAFPSEIIFTSCASESNAMALRGFPDRVLLASAVEHPSVLRYADHSIPVLPNGLLDMEALERTLANSASPALVSVMLANNETGVIQPMRDIAACCKKYGALLHCDAAQALGKIHLDMTSLGVDMMTLAAHKIGGPLGAAALIVRQGLELPPLLLGGGQELRRRGGTENIPAIAGFAAALEAIDLAHMARLETWRDAMEARLREHGFFCFPETQDTPRLPSVSCLGKPGISQELLLMKLDLAGFSVSAGSACSSGKMEPSHVLLAMGVERSLAACAIRISGGWGSQESDFLAVTEALLRD